MFYILVQLSQLILPVSFAPVFYIIVHFAAESLSHL